MCRESTSFWASVILGQGREGKGVGKLQMWGGAMLRNVGSPSPSTGKTEADGRLGRGVEDRGEVASPARVSDGAQSSSLGPGGGGRACSCFQRVPPSCQLCAAGASLCSEETQH